MSDNHSKRVAFRRLGRDTVFSVQFMKAVCTLFSPQCGCGLITLKFHILNHLADNLEHFRTASVWSTSAYEHFNFILKLAYESTSTGLQTRKKDNFNVLNINLKRQKISDSTDSLDQLLLCPCKDGCRLICRAQKPSLTPRMEQVRRMILWTSIRVSICL